ncbi:MAG: hypothetical protein HY057_07045 [Rhodospirillales bacterium]|nr:hypothetical protein [Rhodospirillales bacterium]
MSSKILHSPSCTCCGDLLARAFNRRKFIVGALAGGVSVVLASRFGFAAEGNYEAMVLGCIDPRLQAAIGVVAEPFKDWQKTFWDNLATSIQLHRIKSVIAINHRDCGAAKIAYGADKVADAKIETETHRASLVEFRKQVGQRQPSLKVETGLMALNGDIEMFA